MKGKLKLHLDELAVESFATVPAAEERGTVLGQDASATCPFLCFTAVTACDCPSVKPCY